MDVHRLIGDQQIIPLDLDDSEIQNFDWNFKEEENSFESRETIKEVKRNSSRN